ncbi:flavin reductase family protein [Rummeliibacillus sp. JY-2-4R]
MDDRQFRTAMGKFATGVTVITTEHDGEVHGMTANAFMSVSLDPKLIVISIKENARMLPKIQESKTFSVNILSDQQEKVSMRFAGQLKDEQYEVEFEKLDNQPVIKDALAQITCELAAEHVEGDHTLFIGRVTEINLNEGNPLLFYNGRYSQIAQTVEA